jgi:hypothetical protein
MKFRGNIDPRGSVSIQIAHFREEQSSGGSAGSLSVGAWNTRTLNTTVHNTLGASLGSNRVTLTTGRYYVKGVGTVHGADSVAHDWRSRIRDITNSTILLLGPSVSTGTLAVALSYLIPVEGFITVSGTIQIELQTWADATSDGGSATSIVGINEVYSEIFIWKL